MQKIRIIYEKRDNAKFISHLDLVRVVTRAIKRAELPIVYSQGFNPTPRLNFALPLSLGQESICDVMNIKIEPDMDCEEIKSKLSVQFPDGLVIKEVYVAPEPSVDFKYARYVITVYDSVSEKTVFDCFARDEINVIKKTKSGEKLTDIKPFIKEVFTEKATDALKIHCVLDSKDPNFLNPEYIIKALCEYTGTCIKNYSVLRTQILTEDMADYR